METCIIDYTCTCPHCEQPLEGSSELAGLSVPCPVCNQEFIFPEHAEEEDLRVPAWHWEVNVRVLVKVGPPAYLHLMLAVPRTWELPDEGVRLPDLALRAIAQALSGRYLRCPFTVTKVRVASEVALAHLADAPLAQTECCGIWRI